MNLLIILLLIGTAAVQFRSSSIFKTTLDSPSSTKSDKPSSVPPNRPNSVGPITVNGPGPANASSPSGVPPRQQHVPLSKYTCTCMEGFPQSMLNELNLCYVESLS